MVCKHVYISGHVQGVGFRYRTLRLAGGYDVCGFVKNLPDGRVELVVEGDRAVVDAFLGSLREDMGSYIRRMDQREERASGGFSDFSVRY